MAKVIYDIYKVTNDQSPVFGRHFGRVVHTETMDTEMLAQHIAEHGSPYTEDVVSGVLKKAEKCILEQLLDSKNLTAKSLYRKASFMWAEDLKHESAESKPEPQP